MWTSTVYMDAIHYKVKQDGAIVNQAAYMVIGIALDGNKEVLGSQMDGRWSTRVRFSIHTAAKLSGRASP